MVWKTAGVTLRPLLRPILAGGPLAQSRLQNFAEFLHGRDPELPFEIGSMNGR